MSSCFHKSYIHVTTVGYLLFKVQYMHYYTGPNSFKYHVVGLGKKIKMFDFRNFIASYNINTFINLIPKCYSGYSIVHRPLFRNNVFKNLKSETNSNKTTKRLYPDNSTFKIGFIKNRVWYFGYSLVIKFTGWHLNSLSQYNMQIPLHINLL